MSTCQISNSSAQATPPSSNGANYDTSSKGALSPDGIEGSLHQSVAELGIAPDAEMSSASDEHPVQRGTKTTPIADSSLTCDATFNFSDTNIQIRAGNRLFRIHQFKLDGFGLLRALLEQDTMDNQGLKAVKLDDNPDDFHNLLTVLYSSVHESHSFNNTIFDSTLKLATKYFHPSLRAFAIKEIEKQTRDPIDLFALSRDCGVTEWMTKAIDALCERDEPLTVAEAQVLGMEKFVEVATRREGIKFGRGSRISLGGGKPTWPTKTNPELMGFGRPVSQESGGIIVTPSNLAAIAFESICSASKEGPQSSAPARNATPTIPVSPNIPSDGTTRSQSTAPVLGFRRFGGKPLTFGSSERARQPGGFSH